MTRATLPTAAASLRHDERSVVIPVDFRAAAMCPDHDEGGGFPFALLASGLLGGVMLGAAVAVAGAPAWVAAITGWLSGVALVPILPLLPVAGRRFLNDASAPRGPSAEVVAHPLARDLAIWEADRAAEMKAAAR
jgi:hypothetical protein